MFTEAARLRKVECPLFSPDADTGSCGQSDEHFEAELLPFASGEVGDVGPAFVLTYPIDETTLTVVEGRSGKRLYEVIYDVSRSG